MSDLLTKADVLRLKGWSYEFFTALIKEACIPSYPVGKTSYYMIEDVEAGLFSRRTVWVSTKKKGRRIGNTISPSKSKGIAAAPRQQKREKLKQSMQNVEVRHS